jgi:hypothetical protein
MSLRGTAVIAIWQDLIPEVKADFQQWHNRQHVPERLSIPGFLRARRFVAVEGAPEFFTLYELDRIETASSKGYLDRLNSPTEWTRRVMPAFRNMARSACRNVLSEGLGDGGFLMTIRRQDSGSFSDRLPSLLETPGIVGVHLCIASQDASNIATFEKTFRTAADLMPECVAMIEATSAAAISQAGARLEGGGDRAVYRLEHATSSEDVLAWRQKRSSELAQARV